MAQRSRRGTQRQRTRTPASVLTANANTSRRRRQVANCLDFRDTQLLYDRARPRTSIRAMSDVVDAVVTALSSGATAALQRASGQAVKDAYRGLKSLVTGSVKALPALERRPTDKKARSAVAAELRAADLPKDKRVLAKAKAVTSALQKLPAKKREEWGIDLSDIQAAKNIIIESIEGTSVRIKKVKASTGSLRISGVRGAPSKKK
jgi:hypothetical protein